MKRNRDIAELLSEDQLEDDITQSGDIDMNIRLVTRKKLKKRY